VSIGPLQIGQWPFTATSISTHCLQNVACPHDTKGMFSRAATRKTTHVVGTEAAAGVTIAAAITVTSLLLCPLPSSSVRSYSSVRHLGLKRLLRIQSNDKQTTKTVQQSNRLMNIVQCCRDSRMRLSFITFAFFFGLRIRRISSNCIVISYSIFPYLHFPSLRSCT